jgi:hypothetical protein
LYPASHKEKGEGMSLPCSPPEVVQPTGSSEGVQLWWSAEKAFRLNAKEVLKIVGKFFCCPFSPVLGFSHLKTKVGWLCGARRLQKNASLRSMQVKNFVSAGTKPKSV